MHPMDPGVLALLIPIAGVIGFFGLMGLKTWSSHKLRMR